MLQISETRTAVSSAVIAHEPAEIFPIDVRSLIALHREADAAVDASLTDEDMEPHNLRAHNIYRALVSATPTSLQEEAARLTYILAYLNKFGAASDSGMDGGWLDFRELQHIAKNLTKLSAPVGADALKFVSKSHQPLSQTPEPSLKAQLDHMAKEGDIGGMVALFDYFVALDDAATFSINQPRAASAVEFIENDSGRHGARAYAVADRLKAVSPSTAHHQRERARVLVSAAFLMGGTLKQAAAIMQCLSEGH